MSEAEGSVGGWGLGVAQQEWCEYCRKHSAWVKAQKQEGAQNVVCVCVGGADRGAAGTQELGKKGFRGRRGGSSFMVQDSGSHLQLFELGLGQMGSIGGF